MTTRMLAGDAVVRVEWLPGSDTLLGTCHCGAQAEAQDPITMWEWLLAHPDGHAPPAGVDRPAPDPARLVPVPVPA